MNGLIEDPLIVDDEQVSDEPSHAESDFVAAVAAFLRIEDGRQAAHVIPQPNASQFEAADEMSLRAFEVGIPSDNENLRTLLLAVVRFSAENELYRTELESLRNHLGKCRESFSRMPREAYMRLIGHLRSAHENLNTPAYPPRRIESIPELLEQKVSRHQIALMYGVSVNCVDQEILNPGSTEISKPDFVSTHARHQQQQRKLEDAELRNVRHLAAAIVIRRGNISYRSEISA